MEFKTYTVLTLLVCSGPAFAWQPLTYPIRSQSPYERSVDTALCYAAANKTKVDITREPQVPPRKAPPAKASSTGVPSRPPLPSSTFAAAPTSASMPAAATERGASAPAASAAAPGASSVKSASAPTAGSEAMAATGASAANAELGTSGAAASSSQANAASAVKLPPLPQPEPPMARYWAAYAECMQGRGYVVVQ
ncbi:hypothetical protein [Paraburkholderia sp. DGU8]|uniref:hypothetical protein n=1 Tax=Paraburkholderia sp. DGU8 TaxID=3161997 RepID=UPI003467A96D